MAKQTYQEALEAAVVTLDGKFLMVDTIQDAYTRTYKGNHPYRVIKKDEEYAVYPVYQTAENKLVNEKYPIIQTDGDVIFFTVRTTVDPYNFAYSASQDIAGKNKEKELLHAFNEFIKDEFNFGGPAPYQLFITDDLFVEDTAVDFEFTTNFERDMILPEAGEVSEPEEPVVIEGE